MPDGAQSGSEGPHQDDVEALVSGTADVLALLDRDRILRDLPAALRAASGTDVGFAGQVIDGHSVVIRQLSGVRGDHLRELRIESGRGLGGKVLATGRPSWVEHYEQAATITHDFDVPVTAEGLHGMLALPLLHDGRVLGVAYAATRTPFAFGDVVIDRLLGVTRRAAAAIHVAERARAQTDTALAHQQRRIAAELHDSLGAMLFTLGAQVRDLQARYGDATDLHERLRTIEVGIGDATSTLRRSISELHRVEPEQSLLVALTADCAGFADRTGIKARTIVLAEVPALPPWLTAAVLGAVREGLLNVDKHARATSVVVTVAVADGGLLVAVSDDGQGLAPDPPDAAGDGIGLETTRERLERLGGTLTLVSEDDGGVTLRTWVPLPV